MPIIGFWGHLHHGTCVRPEPIRRALDKQEDFYARVPRLNVGICSPEGIPAKTTLRSLFLYLEDLSELLQSNTIQMQGFGFPCRDFNKGKNNHSFFLTTCRPTVRIG